MKKTKKDVLVAIDFSEHSDAAVAHAFAFPDASDCKFHLVHVISDPVNPDHDRQLLERIIATPDARQQIDFATVAHVLHGHVADELVKYAQANSIDVIVLGSHGRSGLMHLAFGSVAEQVIRKATCPVVVVKPDAAEDTGLPLAKIARALRHHFGETLVGERRETSARLKSRLQVELKSQEVAAEDCFVQLQEAGMLTWFPEESDRSGETKSHWRIDQDSATDRATQMVPTFKAVGGMSTSPALDLVMRAVKLRASDIHIDPLDERIHKVRFRIDGQLEDYCELDTSIAEHLIQQLKIIAQLDIAEPFRPQEGRVALPAPLNEALEARLTCLPVFSGEAASIRLFDRQRVFFQLAELGLSKRSLHALEQMRETSEGLILVTGPTGTGKTTTVYSMLESFGDEHRHIVSIEDPVEFDAKFVRQISVDERHGLTFHQGLKTVLRMDPDVIFVGEIRDYDTLTTALRAAGSGRFVFSTLHTRDVASTITALRDLGIENQSIAAKLNGVINQRLVRRLCAHCREQVDVSERQSLTFAEHHIEPPRYLYQSPGCEKCRGTGFHGRTLVSEAVAVNEALANLICENAGLAELTKQLRNNGTVSLREDAMHKVIDGDIDFGEAMLLH
ncbi:MAG: ATPase, T2SS/T4P/T4SS family [Pirellulaceae bacterium]